MDELPRIDERRSNALRRYADSALRPHDAMAIARAASITATRSHGFAFGARRLAWLLLLAASILAMGWVLATVSQPPAVPGRFDVGTIAYAQGADLYVAALDGTGARMVVAGVPGTEIRELAFAPDRTGVAYVRVLDADTGAEELVIEDAEGRNESVYRSAAQGPDPKGIIFSWAPDGQRLAVYPGDTNREIALIGRDGRPVGRLDLTDEVCSGCPWYFAGVSWRDVATLSWSPDAAWIAVPSHETSGPPPCAEGSFGYAVCYVLLATDGTGRSVGLDEDGGSYLAWAPDGRIAVAHEPSVKVWSAGRDTSRTVVLPEPIAQLYGHNLAWSPEGTRLAVGATFFAQQSDDDPTLCENDCALIYLIGEAGEPVSLTTDPIDGGLQMVAWAPDGDRIVFSTSAGDPSHSSIWSIDADGGTPVRVTDTTEPIFDIAGVAGAQEEGTW
jgi:Tol biopolymer transport system component